MLGAEAQNTISCAGSSPDIGLENQGGTSDRETPDRAIGTPEGGERLWISRWFDKDTIFAHERQL
jgi:hypothetical protein